jgi:hypothetical protein
VRAQWAQLKVKATSGAKHTIGNVPCFVS